MINYVSYIMYCILYIYDVWNVTCLSTRNYVSYIMYCILYIYERIYERMECNIP